MKDIYLDNSATTKVLPEVVNIMQDTLVNNYGNPSSPHNKGLIAEKIIDKTKIMLAKKLGVTAAEIILTSGGTEANNLAIQGITSAYPQRGNHIITSKIEHPSVYEVFANLAERGWQVTILDVDKAGLISLSELEKEVRETTVLVSIMHVNNEIGTIQSVFQAANLIKKNNPLTFFHVDGIQAFGKIPFSLAKSKIDLYTISGHKFHGPKGIGALYLKNGTNLKPIFYGGGQEKGLRSGTENLPSIAGLQPALANLPELEEDYNALLSKKKYLLDLLNKNLTNFKINSPISNFAPHIISVSFPGIRGETLVHALAGEGIFVATGSACSSKKDNNDRVLKAIGLSDKQAEGTIRVSLNKYNSKEELDYLIKILEKQLDYLIF